MRRIAIFLMLFNAGMDRVCGQPNGVRAELQLDQTQYLPAEDMQLKVKIINRSGQAVALGQDEHWITLEIAGESDAVVPKQGEMAVQGPFTLLSGREAVKTFNPTPYFKFRRPGRYRISGLVKIPQWDQQIACKPVVFTVAEGVPLSNLGDLQIGVPPPSGATNAAPEARRYSLLRVNGADGSKLYFRLTDKFGQTMRVFPLARLLSFSSPEAEIDRWNNLHVLLQTGAKTFTYTVLDPDGTVIIRQYHQYTQTRPVLSLDGEGRVVVAGGRRLLTVGDIPPPAPEAAKSP